jgi:hypothetical protein
MLNLSKKSPLNHSFFNQFMGLMCQNIVGSIIRYGIFMKIGSYMKLATPIAKRLLDNNLSLWDSKNGNQIKWWSTLMLSWSSSRFIKSWSTNLNVTIVKPAGKQNKTTTPLIYPTIIMAKSWPTFPMRHSSI